MFIFNIFNTVELVNMEYLPHVAHYMKYAKIQLLEIFIGMWLNILIIMDLIIILGLSDAIFVIS